MKEWLRIWKSPYPVVSSKWKGIIVTSLIIYLLIAVLQPFGISKLEVTHKSWILAGYGFITGLAGCITSYLLPTLFPTYYKECRWTVGKLILNLCLQLMLIVTGNAFYTATVVFHNQLNVSLFIYSSMYVVALAPIPIIFIVMWNRNILLSKNLSEAREMNTLLTKGKQIEDEFPQRQDAATLTFTGSTKEILTINATSFLYAESEGNYVKINYMERERCRQAMLRCTLTQTEDMVKMADNIVRCHRTFLVNIHKVVNVEGNAQGYRLRIDGCKEEIPVSRTYAKSIKQLLSSHVS